MSSGKLVVHYTLKPQYPGVLLSLGLGLNLGLGLDLGLGLNLEQDQDHLCW